jgi:hypothetical protein
MPKPIPKEATTDNLSIRNLSFLKCLEKLRVVVGYLPMLDCEGGSTTFYYSISRNRETMAAE